MDILPEQHIARQLHAGERLLWSGRPGRGLRLRGTDALLIPFSLLWGGFAILWEVTAFWYNASLMIRLWGLPFVAAGLYLMVGRFFWDARRRARTIYAVTDTRIIFIGGAFRRRTRTLSLRTLPDIGLVERRNGSGDIVLGASTFGARFPLASWSEDNQGLPRLEFVPHVREVYDIIRQAHEQVR
jgi:hypothetical protein